MNPELLLNDVEKAISNRNKSLIIKWAILYEDGKIQCVPAQGVKHDGNVFGCFHENALEEGFTPKQWNCLRQRIANFYQRMKLK